MRTKKSKNLHILEEFINSGMDCARVDGYDNSKAEYCASSLSTSIRRFKLFGVKAIKRGDDVFLIKVRN